MTYFVRIRPDAELDLAEAAFWHEQQNPGLGKQFLEAVLDVLSKLEQSPMMYAVVHRQTRRALTRRFPFGLYFRVEDDTVVIVAVMHASRHPQRWKIRK